MSVRPIDANALKASFEEDGHLSGYIEEYIDSSTTWRGKAMKRFWCYGKDDFCDDGSAAKCARCKYTDGKGGMETEYAPMKWISVKDRLPPHQGEKVLVVNGHGDVRIYALWKREYGNKWTWFDVNGKFNHVNDITHWMPLPEPPKEE